jgi:hypothetical protein
MKDLQQFDSFLFCREAAGRLWKGEGEYSGLIYLCAYNTAPHHSRLCVRSRLILVSISMSRKGDRMDAVRIQLKNKYAYRGVCSLCAVSDHVIKDTGTARPSHTWAPRRLCNVKAYKYFWSMNRP